MPESRVNIVIGHEPDEVVRFAAEELDRAVCWLGQTKAPARRPDGGRVANLGLDCHDMAH